MNQKFLCIKDDVLNLSSDTIYYTDDIAALPVPSNIVFTQVWITLLHLRDKELNERKILQVRPFTKVTNTY